MATTAAQNNQSSQQTTQTWGGSRNIIIYIIVTLVVMGIVVLVLNGPSVAGVPTTTVLPTTSASPIYLSISQAQELLGSPIINYSYNYSTASLYNFTSPENVSLLEYFVPALTGNVTNGWITAALGSGTNNASVAYYAIQTRNASSISVLLAQAMSSTLPTLPNTTTGKENGLNYTYETYTNSTGSLQILIGWKDGYVVMVDLAADSPVSNQTQIAQVAAENIK